MSLFLLCGVFALIKCRYLLESTAVGYAIAARGGKGGRSRGYAVKHRLCMTSFPTLHRAPWCSQQLTDGESLCQSWRKRGASRRWLITRKLFAFCWVFLDCFLNRAADIHPFWIQYTCTVTFLYWGLGTHLCQLTSTVGRCDARLLLLLHLCFIWAQVFDSSPSNRAQCWGMDSVRAKGGKMVESDEQPPERGSGGGAAMAALHQCELIQNMIDISISSLQGLRTKCAASNDLTQQEIRTLEVISFWMHDTDPRPVMGSQIAKSWSPITLCPPSAGSVWASKGPGHWESVS